MRCRQFHIVSKKKSTGEQTEKQAKNEKKEIPITIQISTRHRFASSPSLHDHLVWDYVDTGTHRYEKVVGDTSSSARV